MSAPDTNIEKQQKRHRPALWGIKGAMIFGFLMIILLFVYVSMYAGEESADAVTNINGSEAGVVINTDG
ncbi:hypothetical protein [Roseobacter ponti]|uniref:Uncharacterized protein n=1 Tax=Roseobacter ponti TaxID=1891787 RepID=A0A858SR13_9RHOB|nr:hypothetical protein [Roseobacter ponti]QJF50810.1 hypothetical protein G3256_06390 [Roseobacter ponti]